MWLQIQGSVDVLIKFMIIPYSQCCENQKSSEVHTDDHVQIVLLKDIDEVADEKQDDAGDEDCEDVPDERPTKEDADLNACVWAETGVTHPVALYNILGQIFWTNIRQVDSVQGRKIRGLVEILELHLTFLCVKRIPPHVELAKPKGGELSAYEVSVLASRIHIGIFHSCHVHRLKLVFNVPFNVVLVVPCELRRVLRRSHVEETNLRKPNAVSLLRADQVQPVVSVEVAVREPRVEPVSLQEKAGSEKTSNNIDLEDVDHAHRHVHIQFTFASDGWWD